MTPWVRFRIEARIITGTVLLSSCVAQPATRLEPGAPALPLSRPVWSAASAFLHAERSYCDFIGPRRRVAVPVTWQLRLAPSAGRYVSLGVGDLAAQVPPFLVEIDQRRVAMDAALSDEVPAVLAPPAALLPGGGEALVFADLLLRRGSCRKVIQVSVPHATGTPAVVRYSTQRWRVDHRVSDAALEGPEVKNQSGSTANAERDRGDGFDFSIEDLPEVDEAAESPADGPLSPESFEAKDRSCPAGLVRRADPQASAQEVTLRIAVLSRNLRGVPTYRMEVGVPAGPDVVFGSPLGRLAWQHESGISSLHVRFDRWDWGGDFVMVRLPAHSVVRWDIPGDVLRQRGMPREGDAVRWGANTLPDVCVPSAWANLPFISAVGVVSP